MAEQLSDPNFLLAADLDAVLQVAASLPHSADLAAYRMARSFWSPDDDDARRLAYLLEAALACGATELEHNIKTLDTSLPWTTLWTTATSNTVQSLLPELTNPEMPVAIGESTDGRAIIALIDSARTVQIIDVTTQAKLHSFPLDRLDQTNSNVTAIAITSLPTSTTTSSVSTLLTFALSNGQIRIYDLNDGQCITEFSQAAGNVDQLCLGLIDNKLAVFGQTQQAVREPYRVIAWDISTGSPHAFQIKEHFKHRPTICIGTSHNRNSVLVVESSRFKFFTRLVNKTQLWDLSNPSAPTKQLSIEKGAPLHVAGFATIDDHFVAVTIDRHGAVQKINVDPGSQFATKIGTAISAMPGGRTFAGVLQGKPCIATTRRGVIHAWDLHTGAKIDTPGIDVPIQSNLLTSAIVDGIAISAVSIGSSLQLGCLGGEPPVNQAACQTGEPSGHASLTVHAGKEVVVDCDNMDLVRLRDLDTGTVISAYESKSDFNATHRRFYQSRVTGFIANQSVLVDLHESAPQLLDCNTLQPIGLPPDHKMINRLNGKWTRAAIATTSVDTLAVAATSQGGGGDSDYPPHSNIFIWHTNSGRVVRHFKHSFVPEHLALIEMPRSGKAPLLTLALAKPWRSDVEIHIFDPDHDRPFIGKIETLIGRQSSVAFLPNHRLAVGGRAGELEIFEYRIVERAIEITSLGSRVMNGEVRSVLQATNGALVVGWDAGITTCNLNDLATPFKGSARVTI